MALTDHKGWHLPKVEYSENINSVVAKPPEISGKPVTEFVNFIIDRLACFIEDVTAHCIKKKMPANISLLEIPLADRNPEMPVRFRIALIFDASDWKITYSQKLFEEK